MPNVSALNTVLSGYNHIDALLDAGPDWNYLSSGNNTIFYTFSVASGNEVRDSVPVTGQQAFSVSQQLGAKQAFAYISQLTGITFTETANGAAAHVHLCNLDIEASTTTGLCSWQTSYLPGANNTFSAYDADAYIYLDNREFGARNSHLAPGGEGYETLLHELGHMLGLKHPFDPGVQLPDAQDNTSNTLMSYDDLDGPHADFSPYDVAALNWLYGGDGLAGALGIGSATGGRYLTGTIRADTLSGTQFNDTLQGSGGDDMLHGGEGTDTAVFNGTRASYTFTEIDGVLNASGADGTDSLDSIEILRFTDATVLRAQLADTVAPKAPMGMFIPKNDAGYISGNKPLVAGSAEAGATINVYNGATKVGSAVADAKGFWFLPDATALANGSYTLYATATDSSGNTSGASANLNLSIDINPPIVPTGGVAKDANGLIVGNQPGFSGTGEAGTLLRLIDGHNVVIGETVVSAAGTWSIASNPVSNGNYSVTVQSSDKADNFTNASTPLTFTINSSLNRVGTAADDGMTGTAGNNALDGLAGIDTAAYAGARSNYVVAKSTNGFTVTAQTGADGLDSLINIERIQFADAAVALDIDGIGGKAYRIYQAAFDRAPDVAGVGYWMEMMERGLTMHAMADNFMMSQEFVERYGASPSNESFVTNLYLNVLDRPGDKAGIEFWLEALNLGAPRSELLVMFSESPENQAAIIGSIQNGFDYIPWAG